MQLTPARCATDEAVDCSNQGIVFGCGAKNGVAQAGAGVSCALGAATYRGMLEPRELFNGPSLWATSRRLGRADLY